MEKVFTKPPWVTCNLDLKSPNRTKDNHWIRQTTNPTNSSIFGHFHLKALPNHGWAIPKILALIILREGPQWKRSGQGEARRFFSSGLTESDGQRANQSRSMLHFLHKLSFDLTMNRKRLELLLLLNDDYPKKKERKLWVHTIECAKNMENSTIWLGI